MIAFRSSSHRLGILFVALRFREWLGGEHKINEYCHDLAVKGGRRLAEILGTQVLDPDGSLTLNMVRTPFFYIYLMLSIGYILPRSER